MQQIVGKSIHLGGKECILALDLNALIAYAKITGQEVQQGLKTLESKSIGLVEKCESIRILLYASLVSSERWKPENLEEDLATVGNWIQPWNMMKVLELIMDQANQANQGSEYDGQLAPYLPTPPAVVEAVINLAGLRDNDVFLDLGAGDGRLLIAAAEANPTVRAVGYEAHLERYRTIKALIRERRVGTRVAVRNADIMTAGDDIAEATIVFMYLLQGTTNHVFNELRSRFQPGTRIITHDFTIDGLAAESTVSIVSEDGNPHVLTSYLVMASEMEAVA